MGDEQDYSQSEGSSENVVFLIKKLQQQLTFLERKVDILIDKLEQAPAREHSFERPERSFDRPRHQGPYQGRNDRSEAPRGGGFCPSGRFEKRRDDEHRGGFGGGPRKSFGGDREGGAGRAPHPFKKKFSGGKGGFGPKRFPGGR